MFPGPSAISTMSMPHARGPPANRCRPSGACRLAHPLAPLAMAYQVLRVSRYCGPVQPLPERLGYQGSQSELHPAVPVVFFEELRPLASADAPQDGWTNSYRKGPRPDDVALALGESPMFVQKKARRPQDVSYRSRLIGYVSITATSTAGASVSDAAGERNTS